MTIQIIFGTVFGIITILLLFVVTKIILVKAALDETIIAIFKQQEKIINATNILYKSIEGYDRVLNGFNDVKVDFRKNLNELNTEIKLIKDSNVALNTEVRSIRDANSSLKKNSLEIEKNAKDLEKRNK